MRVTAIVLTAAALACSDPVAPVTDREYSAVATGENHTCALALDGTAYCWGDNTDGQLGTGSTESARVPAAVLTAEKFAHLTAGAAHSCGLTSAGRAFCWGWNAYYQLGVTTSTDLKRPNPVATSQRFSSISAGAYHTCAVALDGRVFCWGYNRFGQNGNGRVVTTVPPEEVAGDLRATALSAGAFHTCALSPGRLAFCWGRNDFGQLGIASDVPFVPEPAPMRTRLEFSTLDAGETHTCGVAASQAFCWGSNEFGEIGDGASYRPGLPGPPTPARARVDDSVLMISAGSRQTCATAAERTTCWGLGTSGQLGNGDTFSHSLPQAVLLDPRDGSPFEVVATGGATHSCGIGRGALHCWGSGRAGQLGVGPSTFSARPQRVWDR